MNPPGAVSTTLPAPGSRKDAEGFEIIEWPGGKPHFVGEPVEAFLTAASGRKLRVTVNQMGEYPQMGIAAGEKVGVRLQFASSEPGVKIAVTSQDGGSIADAGVSSWVEIQDDRTAAFVFEAGTNEGRYRVSFTTEHGESKTLEFWVGPPLVFAAPPQK